VRGKREKEKGWGTVSKKKILGKGPEREALQQEIGVNEGRGTKERSTHRGGETKFERRYGDRDGMLLFKKEKNLGDLTHGGEFLISGNRK